MDMIFCCAKKFNNGKKLAVNSAFGRSLEDGTLVLPNPAPLPNTSQQAVPYVIVGDEVFPLRTFYRKRCAF